MGVGDSHAAAMAEFFENPSDYYIREVKLKEDRPATYSLVRRVEGK